MNRKSTKKPVDLPSSISLIPLSQLEIWDKNYRRGDVNAIIASIRRFGFNGALCVRGNRVMAGNHALVALKRMHEEGDWTPTHIVEDPSGGWLVPCIDISHLGEQAAVAFAIADNRTQELGTVDTEALSDLLKELKESDPDDLISSIGYSGEALSDLLGEPPSFPPESEDSQPRLDKPREVVCPKCGEVITL